MQSQAAALPALAPPVGGVAAFAPTHHAVPLPAIEMRTGRSFFTASARA